MNDTTIRYLILAIRLSSSDGNFVLNRRFYVFICVCVSVKWAKATRMNENTFNIPDEASILRNRLESTREWTCVCVCVLPARKWTMFAQITMQVMQQQWFLMRALCLSLSLSLSIVSQVLGGTSNEPYINANGSDTLVRSFGSFYRRDKSPPKIGERFTYTTSSRSIYIWKL